MRKRANPIGFGAAVRGERECERKRGRKKKGNAFPARTFQTQNRPSN
jgi:hypothetical protein